jgi:hypothetical protein
VISAILPPVLGPLVDGRVFPDLAPEHTPTPWIVYSSAGGEAIVDLDGPDETQNTRVQVDVYADDRDTVDAVIKEVARAMYARLAAVPIGRPSTSREDDTGLSRAQQDFSVYHR